MRARNGLRFLVALLLVQASLVVTLLGVHQALGAGNASAWCNPDRCPGGCILFGCDQPRYVCGVLDECFCFCLCGEDVRFGHQCAEQQ